MKLVELAETACARLHEIDILTSNKHDADSIEATHKELQEILQLAKEINASYVLFQKRLKIQGVQQQELPNIVKEVKSLQLKFNDKQNRRQVLELQKTISPPLKKIQTRIVNEWKRDVDTRLKPHLELLAVVSLLPEIREKEAEINRWKVRLQRYKEDMPVTQKQLDDFDQCLVQLQSHLMQLENLHEDVLKFLKKIYENTATMADVTDEVLDWCRQGKHANVFRISFTQ